MSEFLRLAVDNSADLNAGSSVAPASSNRVSPDIRPLSRHFLTVSDFQPCASAKARIWGQSSAEKISSMTEPSDILSDMSRTNDPVIFLADLRSLRMSEKAYREGLADRMRKARIARGATQEQIGDWLGIGREAYRKHESRGSLPPHLFEPFAALTGLDVTYLLTGRKRAARGPQTSTTQRKQKQA